MTTIVLAVIGFFIVIGIFAFFATRQDQTRAQSQGLLPPRGQSPTDEEVKRLAEGGEKIIAIKFYRRIHQVGLREAKEAVESMAKSR